MSPELLRFPKCVYYRAGNCLFSSQAGSAYDVLTLMRTYALEAGWPGPPSSSALNSRPAARNPTESILEGDGRSLLGEALPEKAILASFFALQNAEVLPHPH